MVLCACFSSQYDVRILISIKILCQKGALVGSSVPYLCLPYFLVTLHFLEHWSLTNRENLNFSALPGSDQGTIS